MSIEIIVALVAGFVSFISPCVLPLVPAYIGYMSGRVTDHVATQINADGSITTNRSFSVRFNTFLHGVAFVTGFAVIFVALGLMTTAFVQTFGDTSTMTDLIGRIGGVMIIFFGLHFMGVLQDLFIWLRVPGVKEQPNQRVGFVTGLVGAVFALLFLGVLNSLGVQGDTDLASVQQTLYMWLRDVLPFTGDATSALVESVIGATFIIVGLAYIGRFYFNVLNRAGIEDDRLIGVSGALLGVGIGLVLALINAAYHGSAYDGVFFSRAISSFAMVGILLAGVYTVERNEAAPFSVWINNPAFSVVFAFLGAALIFWMFTGSLAPWDTESYSQSLGIIGLFSVLALVVAMVTNNAFTQPDAFWTDVIDSLNTMLYADTRRQIDGNGGGGLLSSGFMGVVFAAGWSPCIGPTLGLALTLAANNPDGATLVRSASLMMAYSLGLGIPFLITALMLDSAQGGLRKLTRQMNTIKLVSGAFLVIIGIAIASNTLQRLSLEFSNQFADFSYTLENCVVHSVEGDIRWGQTWGCLNENPRFETLIALNEGRITEDQIEAYENGQRDFSTESEEAIDTGVSDALGEDASILNPQGNVDEAPLDEAPAGSGAIFDDSTSDATNTIPADIEIGIDNGQLAPNFITTTISGDEASLWDYHGQVVLLNFWYTTCGPCRVEMPEFEEAYQELGDEGFVVIAVNREEGPEAITDFAENEVGGLSFPLLLDEDGVIQDQYNVLGYPTSLLLDRNGVVIYENRGPITFEWIREQVESALAS